MENSTEDRIDTAPSFSARLRARLREDAKVLALVACAAVAAPACTEAAAAPSAPPAQPAAITPKVEKPAEARVLSNAFATTAKALRPSVVRIDVESGPPRMARGGRGKPNMPDDVPDIFKHFFDMEPGDGPGLQPGGGMRHGTGSGIVIDMAGDIVTNRHVVEDASKVTITLWDGTELPAKVVGADPRTDVAVVRLEKVPHGLIAARLGDSEKLEVGEWVLAIGSPLGLDQTVTAGIVSGKGRAGRRIHMSGDRVRAYIQTDAKINPGNSGGPLVNLDAEVVGINTLINAGPGGAYGFAIPINEVRRVSQVLLKDGRVRYPFLGVMVGDLSELEASKRATLGTSIPERAAYVSEVSVAGPAAKAGVQAGDIITQIDGRKIEYGADVVDYVSSQPIGTKVRLTELRGGKPVTSTVTLGELPGAEENTVADSGKIGLGLQTLTPDIADSLGLPKGVKGAVISDVAAGSPADRAGLKEGEVIVEVDRKPIGSGEDAVGALRTPHAGGHLVRVRGQAGARFVTLPGGN
ncbi:MAG TPA: trypsin-like peptidase domain-containing protein [Polyangia bacterium]